MSLNPAQQEAVNHLAGPCLVLAGAGSGKTRVITHKIGRLIQLDVPAERVAAITFTNKAAAEMRERVSALVGRPARGTLVCTFHALGVRLLRESGAALGLKPQFSILDSDDVTSLIKDAGGSTDLAQARQWQWAISHWKNQGLNAAMATAAATSEEERHLALLMSRYEERLAAYQSVDFDDLIGLPVKLLREHETVRVQWQQRFDHWLIDEYQDTNATQYELLKLLVGTRTPFTAVGDDDQSIYGWRGATLDNLRRLPVDFPRLKVVKLEQNYRSTAAILRAANNVIASNPKLFPKTLFSELGEGEPVRVLETDHEEHEAQRVVSNIQALRGGGRATAWREFAVLYRANHQARVFEQALRRAQIPYRVSGGQSFFERAEIKDLCAWLRLLANNNDDPAFLRAIATPRRGVGHTSLQALGQFASQMRTSLFEALFLPSAMAVLPARAMAGLQEFGRTLNELEYSARHARGHAAARTWLMGWLKDIGYEQHLHDQAERESVATERWSNVLEFCEWIAKRCGEPDDTAPAGDVIHTPATTLLEAIQTVALISTLSEREGEQDVVTLSTLHAAKGLEWPHVMLVGTNEGLLPFRPEEDETSPAQAERNAARLEEERRLMYVGITRAQRSLQVSWQRRRKKGRDMVRGEPSRFIAEMALDVGRPGEDPRAKLAALRAQFAARVAEAPRTP